MSLGLLSALVATVCFGLASVLQAVAARADEQPAERLDPRLLLRLLGQWRFILGLGLGGLGHVAMVAALRVLPVLWCRPRWLPVWRSPRSPRPGSSAPR